MTVTGILLCAGAARRMGFDKLSEPICGKTAVQRSAEALIAGGVDALVLAAGESTRAYLEELSFSVPHGVVAGGKTRTESVRNALMAAEGDVVLIHDAARCFVTPELVRRCTESAEKYGSGVAAMRATDTAFLEGDALMVVPRERLWLAQTPQAFLLDGIRAAYAQTELAATDDATLFQAAGHRVRFVESTPDNFKLTAPADWARAERLLARFGTGYDTHRLVTGRALVLGGVTIPFERGLLGHSDADVLAHAIMDALLGAAALGDIGRHFPDSDPAYEGADSMALMRRVRELLLTSGFRPAAVDATVIAQRPRLAPYIEAMRQSIAAALELPVDTVSVKATTTEGMNDEGRGLCISAQAVATLK